jgi:hypothetical protein
VKQHIPKKQSFNLEVPVNKPYIIPQTPHVIMHAQVQMTLFSFWYREAQGSYRQGNLITNG